MVINPEDLWERFCKALGRQLDAATDEQLQRAWSAHTERTRFYTGQLLRNVAQDLHLRFNTELFKVDFAMWTKGAGGGVPIVFIESENDASSAHHEVRKLACISAPLRVLFVTIQWDESPGVWPSGGMRRKLLDHWSSIIKEYQGVWPRSGIFALVVGEWQPSHVLRFYANAFDADGNLLADEDQILMERKMK